MSSVYLDRYATPGPHIRTPPPENLGLSIVIPCHKEPALLNTLMSLWECTPPKLPSEVIVVINHSSEAEEPIIRQNETSLREAKDFFHLRNTELLRGFVIYLDDLPAKHAGVGLARKYGMDEAVRRCESVSKNGVIVCLDADCTVSDNYLTALESHAESHPNSQAWSIHYEHDLTTGSPYTQGIIDYELHLRYYVHVQRSIGFSHAYQTIGSSMAVRSEAYQKQGGMNRRKAGEDFYFLHKLIPLGDFTECTSCTVSPSSRKSDRVPFGTGKAMSDFEARGKTELLTYAPQSFWDLAPWIQQLPQSYERKTSSIQSLPPHVETFLNEQDYGSRLDECFKQSTNLPTFINRVFRWFDGFMMMKYAHYCRDHVYPNISVGKAARSFLEYSSYHTEIELSSNLELLHFFRGLDLKRGR